MKYHSITWRELFAQMFFTIQTAALPAVMLSIPVGVLAVFEIMVLGIAAFRPDTVLVLAAVATTAVCVGMSSYAVRKEIDTLRAQGTNSAPGPVMLQVLVGVVAAVLLSFVTTAITGVFFFSVFGHHTSLSQFIGNLTLLTRPSNIAIGLAEATFLSLLTGQFAYRKMKSTRAGSKIPGLVE